ncbi:aldo/keto reductase [Rhodocytophaga aerolata]|uniref:Aldo/keto reductase n=1 Tax=Rhodocytophaga aerolata TaxID=455078 RepID=A0ABT8RC26_9BACT|nr:aldo/keto reductase [Rhodocytophaga aerolata]MDO1449625.1 aldo/keto reductase [Rhodocytophaga aerolata]
MEKSGYTLTKGIAVEGWSPLATGTILDNEILIGLSKKYRKSVAQIILRWDIQRDLITIPRSRKKAHMAENIDIFNFELSPADMSIIHGINKNQRVNPKNDPDNFPW